MGRLSELEKRTRNIVPYIEKKDIEKRYWTIGEVAEEVGVTTFMLRSYIREIPSLTPGKYQKETNRSYRKWKFGQLDKDKLVDVCRLKKTKWFTNKGIDHFLKFKYSKK